MDLLKNKIIVVTGGAGLLGYEFIKAIALNGGIGIIADNNVKLGKIKQNLLNKETNTKNIYFVKNDITKKESILSAIKNITKKFGRIDALVNNAYPKNKNFGRKFENVDFGDFCENINLHLGGYFLCCQQFAEYFKKQGNGNIINMSSIYGVIPPRFEIYKGTNITTPVEYAVLKAGVIHLTKYLAKYYKGTHLRFNSLSPGGILNNQPERFLKAYKSLSLSKGMLDRSDISGTLIFLLSDASKYINGQNITIDDGFTL